MKKNSYIILYSIILSLFINCEKEKIESEIKKFPFSPTFKWNYQVTIDIKNVKKYPVYNANIHDTTIINEVGVFLYNYLMNGNRPVIQLETKRANGSSFDYYINDNEGLKSVFPVGGCEINSFELFPRSPHTIFMHVFKSRKEINENYEDLVIKYPVEIGSKWETGINNCFIKEVIGKEQVTFNSKVYDCFKIQCFYKEYPTAISIDYISLDIGLIKRSISIKNMDIDQKGIGDYMETWEIIDTNIDDITDF